MNLNRNRSLDESIWFDHIRSFGARDFLFTIDLDHFTILFIIRIITMFWNFVFYFSVYQKIARNLSFEPSDCTKAKFTRLGLQRYESVLIVSIVFNKFTIVSSLFHVHQK